MPNNNFADLVLMHGVIYTADAHNTVAAAAAVKNGRFLFVGSDQQVDKYIHADTQVIDLAGRMVTPGFLDTHMHPPGQTLSELYEVQLSALDTLEQYVEAVRRFIVDHPDCSAVYGRGWSWGALQGLEQRKGPRKEYLDDVARDIPIVLRANDGHSLWVNSRALAVNGIDTTTAVPLGGVIERDDASGALWGVLKESAMWLIAQPAYSPQQYRSAMLAFQGEMHRLGITGLVCMAGRFAPDIVQALAALDTAGDLKLRVRLAMAVLPDQAFDDQLEYISSLRAQYRSPYLQLTTAKFFTDGVVEGATSCLLQPYMPAAGRGGDYCGNFLWDEHQLAQAFTLANRHKLQICVHSTGDGSTRKVLDALAVARTLAPAGDYRNTITHLQLVDCSDIPRFRELRVIASLQPYWHFKGPNWWEAVDYRILGERAKQEYPLGSFFAHGVVVTSSSDYPVTVPPNPLRAIDVGVTRNIDNGNFYGIDDIADMDDERYLLNAAERATVAQMLSSFTINAAYAMFMEQDSGSIEPGKLADMAVLDGNLFAVNPSDIDKVGVVMTFVGGQAVYVRAALDK